MTHEEAWRYLYESAPILFLQLDPDEKIIDANRFTRDRIAGHCIGNLLQEILLPFAGKMDLESLRKDEGKCHLMHVVTNGELPETFKVQFVPIGKDTLVFGSLDPEETRRLQKELITLNNRLNVLTRELQKKNRELEELNQLKNQFLGMAAHDLRKPVGAVLNYSEFLIDEAGCCLNDEHFGFLQTIYSSTDLMLSVIDHFLDIARIESGELELECCQTSMREPLEKSVTLNRLTARKKGVELHFEVDKCVAPVNMDSLKVEQILNNLIANAIEHSPFGSKVTIRSWRDQEWLNVAVADSGPGVSVKEQHAIFQPYTRGSARKHIGASSTGLGLVISKKIVEAHQGKIWIEQDSDNGAKFVFCLPYDKI